MKEPKDFPKALWAVTIAEITQRLSAECGMPLVPPDATVSLAPGAAGSTSRLKALGSYPIDVQLKTGDVVRVDVKIEPKIE